MKLNRNKLRELILEELSLLKETRRHITTANVQGKNYKVFYDKTGSDVVIKNITLNGKDVDRGMIGGVMSIFTGDKRISSQVEAGIKGVVKAHSGVDKLNNVSIDLEDKIGR